MGLLDKLQGVMRESQADTTEQYRKYVESNVDPEAFKAEAKASEPKPSTEFFKKDSAREAKRKAGPPKSMTGPRVGTTSEWNGEWRKPPH
jgi:hypothetical protein